MCSVSSLAGAALLVVAAARAPANLAQIVYLTAEAASMGAVCLDGSPAAYYFRAEAEAAKIVIHQQGGGWCSSDDNCYDRSLGHRGSSKGYPATFDLDTDSGGYLSNDAAINPMLHNWTKLYLPYCDGGSQTGDLDTPVPTSKGTIYYRGHRILVAMQANLLANATVGIAQATDVIIGGSSAGGLSVFLHADSWTAALPSTATVVAMPDSGFFLDFNSTRVPFSYEDLMRWVYTRMNATASIYAPACAAANAADPALCIFAEHISPTLATPTFALQSEFDAWQIGNDLFSKDKAAVNDYGALLTKRLQEGLLASAPAKHGTFLDSCLHHTDNSGQWGNLTVDGVTQAGAFQAWYGSLGQSGARKEWRQGKPYPCIACCKPQ